jgi:hypothetical protein
MARLSFQFTARSPKQTGAVYVTLTVRHAADIPETITRAARIAAQRSGDPEPEFVRMLPPVR